METAYARERGPWSIVLRLPRTRIASLWLRLLARWPARRSRIRVSRLSDDWLRRHEVESRKHGGDL